MGVRTLITHLLSDGKKVIRECRQCGANVAPDTDECPECGTSEFVRYEIPE